MPDLQKLFGRQLREARRARGLTQIQLAERIDRSLDLVGRMERGEVAPSFETVERVVRELDVPPSFLFGGQDALRTDRTALIEEALNALGRLKETDLRLAIRLIAALPEKRRE